MQRLLTSPMALLALFGTVLALLRRDWRVLPLLAWLLATLYLLWQQVLLFHHPLLTLIPPMIALAVIGIWPYGQELRIKFTATLLPLSLIHRMCASIRTT